MESCKLQQVQHCKAVPADSNHLESSTSITSMCASPRSFPFVVCPISARQDAPDGYDGPDASMRRMLPLPLIELMILTVHDGRHARSTALYIAGRALLASRLAGHVEERVGGKQVQCGRTRMSVTQLLSPDACSHSTDFYCASLSLQA